MPKKLPVILAQSARVDAERRRLEETLVGRLLMERGIEMNLIPALETLENDTTGALCLQGYSTIGSVPEGGVPSGKLKTDVMVLGWQGASEAFEVLRQLGMEATPGRTKFDSNGEVGPTESRSTIGPRLYYIDLTCVPAADVLLEEVRRIRAEATVPMVTLGTLGGSAAASPLATNGATNGATRNGLAGTHKPADVSVSKGNSAAGPVPLTMPILPILGPVASQPMHLSEDAEVQLDRELDSLMAEFDDLTL